MTAFRASEEISGPYAIAVDVAVDAGGIAASAMLRKGARIEVFSDGAVVRRFEGLVMRVRERWQGAGPVLTLSVESPLALLALSNDCRIFQEQTTRAIVANVLGAFGVPADRVIFRLSRTYAAREVCTQYAESMLDFVQRLLEEDGIFHFVEAGPDGAKIVIGDAPGAHPSMTPATIPVALDTGLTGGATITSLSIVERVRPTKVTLRDRDWKRPLLDLEASAEAANVKGGIAREVYDPSADYVEAAEGKQRAKNLLEALVAGSTGVRGESTVPAMAAGHAFTMAEAFDSALDGEWVVTRVEHAFAADGSEPYSNRFVAVPKKVPFRPPLRTPRPRIVGPQTAIVTGPASQEIHTDAHGRVKLKFPWDRHAKFDDKSSGWARVAQVAMSGSMTVPRVGWEVLVEFEHGDPDRPVVVGRLFNGAYPPPYPLPQHKTRSTLGTYTSPGGSGHNEIRIEDAAGSEHFHLHAQRDFALSVANSRDEHVGSSQMTSVKHDARETVAKKRTLTIDGMNDVTIGGGQKLTVGSKRETVVKKDEHLTVAGDRALEVTGSHTIATEADGAISSGGDVDATIAAGLEESADGAYRFAVGDDASWTIGGTSVESAKKGRREAVGGKVTSTVAGAAAMTSSGDLTIAADGDRSVTVGAAWTLTAGGDVVLSSGDALEITVAAALALTGAEAITLKVGASKVTIGQGGIVIDAPKVKLTADGPAMLAAAVVASK